MKKITFAKILSYVRNKYYGINLNSKIIKQAKKSIKNYDEYIYGLTHPTNPSKKYTIKFNNGLIINCRENDLSAIAETCLIDDYGKVLNNKNKKDLIIFDIGAHIGSFSVNAAKEGARVYSFEPNPDNYKLLLENIKINNLEEKVTPCNIAITDKEGDATLQISSINYGGHSINMDTGEEGVTKIHTDTLKNCLHRFSLSKIDLIKIDIEGSEYLIFENIEKDTLDRIGEIIGEYHLSIDQPTQNFSLIKKYLSKSFPKIKRYDPYYFYAYRNK